MTYEEEENLENAGENPDIDELLTEFNLATSDSGLLLKRKTIAEEARYCLWNNQNDDGKKHDVDGEQAFPWDGASDTRIRLADEVVVERTAVLKTAFARANFSAIGIEMADMKAANAASKGLEWARQSGIAGLRAEVELAAQWGQTYGWSVVHTVWERRIGRRYKTLTMDEVHQSAAQPGNPVAMLVQIMHDPTLDEESANLIRGLWSLFCLAQSPGLFQSEIGELSMSKAKKVLNDLRDKGEVRMSVPYLMRNNPVVVALKPGEDVFVPVETVDLERARWICRLDWLTAVELKAKVLTENWDEAWVEKVLESTPKNDISFGSSIGLGVSMGISATGLGVDLRDRRNMHPVLWFYRRCIDAEGVEGVWCTIASPSVYSKRYNGCPDFAKNELLNYAHGEYPFKAYRQERPDRKLVESRGVPEICSTWQRETKAQRDACFDRTSLSVLPPFKAPERYKGKVYRLKPGGIVWTSRPDELQYMESPTGNMREALELMREIAMDTNRYFGRRAMGVDPNDAQLKQQDLVDEFLLFWMDVMGQVLALMEQFMSDDDWIKIAGDTAPARDWETIQRRYAYMMKFDVREMGADYLTMKLEALTKMVLPMDSAGVIDRSKLVQLIMAQIDPQIAQAIMTDQAAASQKLFNQVTDDFSKMMNGFESMPVEKDPTAGRQLEYAQQIIGANPKAQQQLQGDQNFQALAKKWMENRQFSVQQEQNAQIGKIGVNGMGADQQALMKDMPRMAGAGMEGQQ